jgi:hypothetical protein
MSATIMKWTKAAVICFYLSVIVGLALYDESPRPELAQDATPPLPEILESGNVWIAFLGFDAPQGVSPYVHGEEKMLKRREALVAGKKDRTSSIPVEDDKSDLIFKGKLPSFTNKKDGGMLAFAAAHPEEIAALSDANEELLHRYEELAKFPRSNEPLDCGFFGPTVGYLLIKRACRLNLLRLADKALRGDMETALVGVRRDAEFWRLIARSSNTLISKCVALAIIRMHLSFTAELATSRQMNGEESAIVRDILRPFEKGEVGFAGALRGECRYAQNSLRLIWLQAKSWNFGTGFVYKPNATCNRLYEDRQASGIVPMAEMGAREFALQMRKESDSPNGMRRLGIPLLYNPVGEIIAVRSRGFNRHLLVYIELGHNLEGFRRLSRLKVLAHAENILPDGMRQFLDSHEADLGNPYTDAPMEWNPKRLSISFTDLDGKRISEIFL